MKCPRCNLELIRCVRDVITKKDLAKSYIFTEWHKCPSCNYIKMNGATTIKIDLGGETKKISKNKKPKHHQELTKKVEPKDYNQYINSKRWERFRKDYYKKYKKECSLCGSITKIHLHHIVYKRLGIELEQDVTPLCEEHHNYYHKHYKNGDRKEFRKFTKEILRKQNTRTISR